jgi:hypothetical protein
MGADTRFKPGRSGNPGGRPKGSRNKATVAIEALLDGEGEEITRKAIELAKNGDMGAIRVCMDRIAPPRRERHVTFALPKMQKACDAVAASAAIVEAVSGGELTPSEAGELIKVVENYARTLQASDFEARLERLEKQTGVSMTTPGLGRRMANVS